MFYDSTEMEVHALAPAPNGGLYVGTSPDGRIYASMRRARRPRSSIPTTSTSGRSSSIATATCSPAPATRARSTRSRPTARARSSSRRRPRMRWRWRSIRIASCSSAPARPAACSASTPRARASCCSTRPYQEMHAMRVDAKGVIYAAAQSGRAQGRRCAPGHRRSAPPPGHAVDPERLDGDHVDHRRRCRRRAPRRRLVVRRAPQHHDRRRVSRAAGRALG